VFKRIDTVAAEFEAKTPYMYSTYEAPSFGEPEDESAPSDRRKIVILGGGPNRIGQGIEFDYCCCHAAYALREAGFETIMINCNPETVSTDYDTSDRLYFEPLTAEDVLEVLHVEASAASWSGSSCSLADRRRSSLRRRWKKPEYRSWARRRMRSILPRTGSACGSGRPARPQAARERHGSQPGGSYRGGRADRLSGADAAQLCAWRAGDGDRRRAGQLEDYIVTAVQVSGDSPVLIDQYLRDAIEVDVDAISDGKDVVIAGVMQHIEEAGFHSGDSACSLPPYSLPADIVAEIERQTRPARARAWRGRPDERPVRGQGRPRLSDRGQSARQPDRAVRRQGDRHARSRRSPRGDGRRALMQFLPIHRDIAHVAVKEAVFPLRASPGSIRSSRPR
jgi:carbamoyl-phosphate synthase large subunit